MNENKFEDLNYDVLSIIRNLLPSEDKNKLSLLNKDLKDTFIHDERKEKNKKLQADFEKLTLFLAQSLQTNFSDKSKLKEINKILRNFISLLDPETLKKISSDFQSLESKIKTRLASPTIKYIDLFEPVLKKFNSTDEKEIENLCKILDQSENKDEETIVKLFSKLKKISFTKILGIHYVELAWFLSIVQARRSMEAKGISIEGTANLLEFIEMELQIPSHLKKDTLAYAFNAGFLLDNIVGRFFTEGLGSLAFASLFLIPFIIIFPAVPIMTMFLTIATCIFLLSEIIQQSIGIGNMVSADKEREKRRQEVKELKEELNDNLFLFFRASSQVEEDNIEELDDRPTFRTSTRKNF